MKHSPLPQFKGKIVPVIQKQKILVLTKQKAIIFEFQWKLWGSTQKYYI
jgi:hypothetical protein